MHIHELEIEECYNLIGIHSAEEDYKIAYLLNRDLNTSFKRFKHNLDFKNKNASFSVFEFNDEITQLNTYLISNKYIEDSSENTNTFGGLFSENISFSSNFYLIPEKKSVDYFLKLEGEITTFDLRKLIKKLNTIPQIITSYNINPSTLKSKDFLIF